MGVGTGSNGLDVCSRNVIDKQRDNLCCQGCVTPGGENLTPGGQCLIINLRVLNREVESTIRGEATEQNIAEASWGAAGITRRNVVHG